MKVLLLAALLLAACSKQQEVTAPPAPLRPEPEPVADSSKKRQKDCELITTEMEERPMAFDQRAITESAKLSDGARSNLKLAESAEIERVQREDYITDAVRDL